MIPKPRHLGAEYAAVFKYQSVADAYHNRPPYPAEAIELLAGFALMDPARVGGRQASEIDGANGRRRGLERRASLIYSSPAVAFRRYRRPRIAGPCATPT